MRLLITDHHVRALFHGNYTPPAMTFPEPPQPPPVPPDYMPREGVNGFSLKGNAHQLVDAALQVYARTGMYPEGRALHEAAMAYRAELIRIVSEHRVEHPI